MNLENRKGNLRKIGHAIAVGATLLTTPVKAQTPPTVTGSAELDLFEITDYFRPNKFMDSRIAAEKKVITAKELDKAVAYTLGIRDISQQYRAIRYLNFGDDSGLRGEYMYRIKEYLHPYIQYIVFNRAYNEDKLLKLKTEANERELFDSELMNTVKRVHTYLSSNKTLTKTEKLNYAVIIARNLIAQELQFTDTNIQKELEKNYSDLSEFNEKNPFQANYIGVENIDNSTLGKLRGNYTPLFSNHRLVNKIVRINAGTSRQAYNFRPEGSSESSYKKVVEETTKAISKMKGKSLIVLSGHGFHDHKTDKTTFHLDGSQDMANVFSIKRLLDAVVEKYSDPENAQIAMTDPDMIIGNFCFSTNFAEEFSRLYTLKNEERLRSGKPKLPPILFLASSEKDEAQLISANGYSSFMDSTVINSQNIKEIVGNLRTHDGKTSLFLIGGKRGKIIQLGSNEATKVKPA